MQQLNLSCRSASLHCACNCDIKLLRLEIVCIANKSCCTTVTTITTTKFDPQFTFFSTRYLQILFFLLGGSIYYMLLIYHLLILCLFLWKKKLYERKSCNFLQSIMVLCLIGIWWKEVTSISFMSLLQSMLECFGFIHSLSLSCLLTVQKYNFGHCRKFAFAVKCGWFSSILCLYFGCGKIKLVCDMLMHVIFWTMLLFLHHLSLTQILCVFYVIGYEK